MAWVDTKEDSNQAQSSVTSTEKTATRYFVVKFDAISTTTDAENASDIPAFGDVLPGDATITTTTIVSGVPTTTTTTNPYPRRRSSISVKAVDQTNQIPGSAWYVQVDYTDKLTIYSSPLSVPDDISWDFSSATQSYFLDNSSTPKPCVNSAGEAFEQFLSRETGSVTVTIKRNQASFNAAQAITYCGDDTKGKASNTDTITIDGQAVTAGQALLSAMSAGSKKIQNGVQYREVTYVLKLKASWNDTIADYGFQELDSGSKLTPIYPNTTSTTQQPLRAEKPWPLDGSGHKKTNASDTPATLTFKPYKQLPFGVFGFS